MANRKLQGEIDRVLKKVDEGVQIFEQIWDKVYGAATTAQKEKYEGDLKKEIKKLQRLRDQIKTWQGDSSIKDKTKLDANRKLIEEKMEKFKVCEKETKTKAFSKEGLAQDRTDPKQKAKAIVGDWARESISRLTEQCEEMEAEIETLNSGKRKKRNDENPRVTQLKEFITRHEHHKEMLEKVLRAVYNDAVSPEEAEELKESVDYYIESNQDPDFFEDDEMYDMLNLEPTPPVVNPKKGGKGEKDEEDESSPPPSTTPPSSSKKGPSSPRNSKAIKTKEPVTSSSSATKPVTIPRNVSPKQTRSGDVSPANHVPAISTSPSNAANSTSSDTPVGQLSPRSPRKAAPVAHAVREGSVPPVGMSQPLLSSVVRGASNGNSVVSRATAVTQASPTNVQTARQTVAAMAMPKVDLDVITPVSASAVAVANGSCIDGREVGGLFPMPFENKVMPVISVATAASVVAAANAATVNATATAMANSTATENALANANAGAASSAVLPNTGVMSGIPSPVVVSAMSPVSPARQGGASEAESASAKATATELQAELELIENALPFMPETGMMELMNGSPLGNEHARMGSEERSSQVRYPMKTPASFPSVPAPVFDSREVFQQFDPDTLFFIFYYQQGTFQQYLAASELKRQGWRFHKKYLTWFQRHDEPKVSTDEYETGTFIYFDYANVVVRGQGSGWCQRIKSEFVFEYQFLEDELV